MNYSQDFPLLKNLPELSYLDNAATTQKPQIVIDSIVNYYAKSNANVHRGIYKLSENATIAYESARETIAKFINAETEEVIFTSGTTASINLLANYYFQPLVNSTDTILLTELEHHSNILPWQQISKTTGAKLKYLPIDANYQLDLAKLEQILTSENVAVFSVTHCSNVTGVINPIEDIIATVNRISPNTKIVIDAAQSLAHLPIDVKSLGCDFLVASGHKAYGPTGVGIIYGKKDLLEKSPPFFTGGGMIAEVNKFESSYATGAQKFEAGTPNIAGVIGFEAAIKYIQNIGWKNILEHEVNITNSLFEKLKAIPTLTIYGPTDVNNRLGVFSFNIKNIHPHDLAQLMDQDDIAIRAGHHCTQILHKKIFKVSATCRASIAIYNEEKDITKLATSLEKISKSNLFN